MGGKRIVGQGSKGQFVKGEGEGVGTDQEERCLRW